MTGRELAPLPAQLAALFPGGCAGRGLTVPLPAGRLVWPDRDTRRGIPGARPAYWLSDAPPPAGLWSRLHAEHPSSGLWPLLLEGFDHNPARPWVIGEVWPEPAGSIDPHDPAAVLAAFWTRHADLAEGDYADAIRAEFLKDVAPFGLDWPGLAEPGEPMHDPAALADRYVAHLADSTSRLGLVAAGRGADAIAACGWGGAGNYSDRIAPLAAVVRSWEDRFGARVVRIGFDTLDLSVAAPPVTIEHTLRVAAEHFAFCSDNVLQCLDAFGPHPLRSYAERIRRQNAWTFWWD